jgi:hypothetical protein
MCHLTTILAKKAGMSVNSYLQSQNAHKVRTYRNLNYELRGHYEQTNGKTRLFWRAYMLTPYPCIITDIHQCTDPRVVSADLTEWMKGESHERNHETDYDRGN